jgi:hypothetical protein
MLARSRMLILSTVVGCSDNVHELAHPSTAVTELSVDGSSVFWKETSRSYALGPGGSVVEFGTGVDLQAFANGRIYWISPTPTGTTIESIDETGGPVSVIAQGPLLNGATFLTAQGADLYWITLSPSGTALTIDVLRAGGAPEVVVSLPSSSDQGFAVDDTGIYWAQNPECDVPGAIMRTSLDGTSSSVLASRTCPSAPRLAGSMLFWEEQAPTIVSIPETGGAPSMLDPSASAATGVIPAAAVDASGIYWWQPDPQTAVCDQGATCPPPPTEIWRTPLDGGLPERLAGGLDPDIVYMTSNDSALFWVQENSSGSPAIVTMPK